LVLKLRALLTALALVELLPCGGCLRGRGEPEAWPCDTDNDCRNGKICYRSLDGKRACRSTTYCETDDECGAEEACFDDACEVVTCKESYAPLCFPFSCYNYECRTDCQDHDDCQAGYSCRDAVCVPHECDSSTEAQVCAGYRCADGLCRESCRFSIDCSSDFACKSGLCVLQSP